MKKVVHINFYTTELQLCLLLSQFKFKTGEKYLLLQLKLYRLIKTTLSGFLFKYCYSTECYRITNKKNYIQYIYLTFFPSYTNVLLPTIYLLHILI